MTSFKVSVKELFILLVCSAAVKCVENVQSSTLEAPFHLHQKKVCDSSGCSMNGTEPTANQFFKVRLCACDQQCPVYNDCCPDSGFVVHRDVPSEYACIATTFDGGVYMKTSCPPTSNHTVKENCESPNATLLRVDVLLSTPVTSTRSQITYRNLFCALCHNENDFEFWNIGLAVELLSSAERKFTTPPIPAHFVDNQTDDTFDESIIQKVLQYLAINDTDNDFWFWTSSFDDRSFLCWMNATLPKTLTGSVRFCELNVEGSCAAEKLHSCIGNKFYVYLNNSVYETLSHTCGGMPANTLRRTIQISRPTAELRIRDKNVPKVDHCSEIPDHTLPHTVLCENANVNSQIQTYDSCFVFRRPDTKKACLVAKYYPNSEIERRDKMVYLKPLQMEFPPEEWDTDDIVRPNETFICGTYAPNSYTPEGIFEIVDDMLTSILTKISMVCLLLHLLVYQQLPGVMRNLPNKNLMALSATLLLAYSCLEINPLLPSCCAVLAVILHYALLSCFAWTLVMSFDCWYSLYVDTSRFRIPTSKRRTKFRVYCAISWSTPLLLIGMSLYLELSPPDVVTCDFKPYYGESTECFIFGKAAHFLLFVLPAFVMFLGNLSFFGHTVYTLSRLQRERQMVNSQTRHSFRLYTKLALLMGATWMLGIVVHFTRGMTYRIFSVLFSALNMSHGTLFFLLFTLRKKEEMRSLLKKRDGNWLVRIILLILSKADGDAVSVRSKDRSQSKSTEVCEMVSV